MREFWDQRYSSEEYAYGTAPNAFFRQIVEDCPPGRLLLPGEGEGRNAVYAARRGWDVTAFDFSAEARRKALALAKRAGVAIRYEQAGWEEFEGPADHFDMIALIFVHLPEPDRRLLHSGLRRYLRTGGRVVLEAFSKKQIMNNTGGPRNPAMLYNRPELMSDFAGMTIEQLGEEDVLLSEGKYHHGWASVIRLTARRS
jgi:SAM-dependent methyltransferase